MTTRKRNPNDATMRNVRALEKRIESLERFDEFLLRLVMELRDEVKALKKAIAPKAKRRRG